MNGSSRGARSLLLSLLAGVVIAALVLPLFAVANQSSLQSAARTANASNADAQANLISAIYMNDIRAARDLAVVPDVETFHQNAVNRQLTWPEITGAYLVGKRGRLRFGLWLDPAGLAASVQTLPPGLNVAYKNALGHALARTLRGNVESSVVSFGKGTGPLGSLYFFEPITNLANQVTGAVVLRINNQAVLGPYLSRGNVLLVASPFVISGATANLVAHGQAPVRADLPASVLGDSSLFNGLTPMTTLTMRADQANTDGTFEYQGVTRVGAESDVDGLPGFEVVSYSDAPTFATSLNRILTGGVGLALIILLVAGTVVLVVFQRGRVTTAAAALDEIKSRQLTQDVLTVSQALSVAREGDLTVEVPNLESEVGLVSVLINGLLTDYSQIVGGIIQASRAVRDGALKVDQSVRTIVDVAARQSDEMTATAGTVEALAGSAATVQESTRRATELAAEAAGSVELGQEAVGRIGEAVDSIKEAAIGTTREFKRLQEDSIRLTALVSSVKSNAENLDMQAANAALEARHLGTETGSVFATNIGRLARQAQETLADAETAVRSVVSSIDAVNRRIERISEQVRLGVDEVRSVRANFDDITATNQSLVQFIEGVAETARAQAGNAQGAAASIVTVAAAFRQFNDLLVSSSDEMAHMRLIVADLQESVANLRVDDTLLIEDDGAAAYTASAELAA